MARDPFLMALVLADNVVPDPNSGKNYILGTITRLFAKELPARMNQIAIYLCIGDAQDCSRLMVEVLGLKDETVIFKQDLPPLPERRGSDALELSICLGGVTFPEFGTYEFRIWTDGRYIGSRRFAVEPWPEEA